MFTSLYHIKEKMYFSLPFNVLLSLVHVMHIPVLFDFEVVNGSTN